MLYNTLVPEWLKKTINPDPPPGMPAVPGKMPEDRSPLTGGVIQDVLPWLGGPEMKGAVAGASKVGGMLAHDPRLAALFLHLKNKVEFGPWVNHEFDIFHDSGKRVGNALITYGPDKDVHVDMIRGEIGAVKSPFDRNSYAYQSNRMSHGLGTKEIRSLLTAVKQQFPNAETVSGFRISGARSKGRTEAGGEAKIRIRPKNVGQQEFAKEAAEPQNGPSQNDVDRLFQENHERWLNQQEQMRIYRERTGGRG